MAPLPNKTKYLAAFLLLSCTRGVLNIPDELVRPDDNLEGYIGKSLDAARADVAKTTVTCEGDSCTQDVALMVAIFQKPAEDESGGRYVVKQACTASVVKIKRGGNFEKYFLTAGHCVPNRFLDNAAACNQDIQFIMPSGKRLPCEKIVSYYLPTNADPWVSGYDLALIKAPGIESEGFELSNNPMKSTVANPYPISVVGADIDGDWTQTLKAKLKVRQCFQVRNTFILPNTNQDPTPPLFVVRACGIQDGYSGGPVLDGRTVLGVISFNNEYQQGGRRRPKDLKGADPALFRPLEKGLIGAASNVSCLNKTDFSYACDKTQNPQRVAYISSMASHNGLRSLDPAAYLSFFELGLVSIKSENHKTLGQILTKLEASAAKKKIPAGFAGPWIFRNFSSTTSTAGARVPVPRCYLAGTTRIERQDYPLSHFNIVMESHPDLTVEFSGYVARTEDPIQMEFSGGELRLYSHELWGDKHVVAPLQACGP